MSRYGRSFGLLTVLVAVVAVFVPILIHLPSIFGEGYSRSLITIISLGMVLLLLIVPPIISFSTARETSRALGELLAVRGLVTKCFVAFLLISALAEMRGGLALTVAPFSYVGLFGALFALFLVGYFLTATSKIDQGANVVMHCFALSFVIYVSINILGHFSGMQAGNLRNVSVGDSGANMLLGAFGVSYPRVFFPFAAGLNNFAVFSGICLLLALGGVFHSSGVVLRGLYVVAACVGLAGVILTDSRGVLLMVFLAMLISRVLFLTRRSPIYIFLGLVVLGVGVPYFVVIVSQNLNDSVLLSLIQREGSFANRLGVFSGRDVIWAAVIQVIFEGWSGLVFGYGSFGQITSGASESYSWIFSGLGGAKTAHNSALQVGVDSGMFGVAVWVALWAGVGVSLSRLGAGLGGRYRTFASVLLMLILAGWTEATCTIYTMDMMMIMVFVLGLLQGWSFSNSASCDVNGKRPAGV